MNTFFPGTSTFRVCGCTKIGRCIPIVKIHHRRLSWSTTFCTRRTGSTWDWFSMVSMCRVSRVYLVRTAPLPRDRIATRRAARCAWAVTLGVAALPRSGARAARLFSAGASAIDEIANCRKAAYPFAGRISSAPYLSILRLRSKKGVSVDFCHKNLPLLFFLSARIFWWNF